MDLILTASDADSVTVITVEGDVDVASAHQLGEALDGHMAVGRTHLVLDLSLVPFMDSSGLGVLVGRLRRARSLGGAVHLAGARSRIERIVDITGLDQVFTLHDGLDEAVRACRDDIAELPSLLR